VGVLLPLPPLSVPLAYALTMHPRFLLHVPPVVAHWLSRVPDLVAAPSSATAVLAPASPSRHALHRLLREHATRDALFARLSRMTAAGVPRTGTNFDNLHSEDSSGDSEEVEEEREVGEAEAGEVSSVEAVAAAGSGEAADEQATRAEKKRVEMADEQTAMSKLLRREPSTLSEAEASSLGPALLSSLCQPSRTGGHSGDWHAAHRAQVADPAGHDASALRVGAPSPTARYNGHDGWGRVRTPATAPSLPCALARSRVATAPEGGRGPTKAPRHPPTAPPPADGPPPRALSSAIRVWLVRRSLAGDPRVARLPGIRAASLPSARLRARSVGTHGPSVHPALSTAHALRGVTWPAFPREAREGSRAHAHALLIARPRCWGQAAGARARPGKHMHSDAKKA